MKDTSENATQAEAPVDWEKAFKALTLLSCRGFVSSHTVDGWAEQIGEHVDPRAAAYMIKVFYANRNPMMQDFMG